MAEVKWIKITTDIFDDEKLLLIETMPDADSIIVIWFKLLVLAGKQNNHGVIMMSDRIAYTDEMLASIFRRPLTTVRLALGIFEQYGMIEIIEGVITIPNWEKHQSLDQLEQRREYMKNYMKKKRQEQKQLITGECKVNSKVNVNSADVDKNKNKNKKENIDISEKKARNIIPPTLEMVEDYINENGYSVDANAFMDYYESKGWIVGKSKMKDWQATVRNWNRNQYNKPSSDPVKTVMHDSDLDAIL